MKQRLQLISYIAPAAPATRRPATGSEPFVRAEIGFTPAWYRQHLKIDFGRKWHIDPAYRTQTVQMMRDELKKRFSQTSIGNTDQPFDILTGTFGCCTIAAIFGLPVIYSEDNWPNCEHEYLSDEQLEKLQTPDLDTNPFFESLMSQVDWIAQHYGRVEGFINFQGVLNNAYRLRGKQLFVDMLEKPQLTKHLFDCVCETMIAAAKRLHKKQCQSGVDVNFFTVSNCMVNMISPEQYGDFLLPLDQRIAEEFGLIGIHNCAWNADPYIDQYAKIPNVAYIDMSQDSDLEKVKKVFSNARRAIMYSPVDLAEKGIEEIKADFTLIAEKYAPCDIVLADIEAGTDDQRVLDALKICKELI